MEGVLARHGHLSAHCLMRRFGSWENKNVDKDAEMEVWPLKFQRETETLSKPFVWYFGLRVFVHRKRCFTETINVG